MLDPLYSLFITIAKPFQQVGAKCITPDVLALCKGSNGMQRFERKYSIQAKQVAPLKSYCFMIYHKLQMDFLDNSIHS